MWDVESTRPRHPIPLVILLTAAVAIGLAPAFGGTARAHPDAASHGRPAAQHRSGSDERRGQPHGATGWLHRAAALTGTGAPVPLAERPPAAIRGVQRRLHRLGFRPGPVDGIVGPRTRAAVAWLEIIDDLHAAGCSTCPAAPPANAQPPLPAAGWHGRAIRRPHRRDERMLAAAPAHTHRLGAAGVRAVQRLLRRRGYEPGPVDGIFGPRTRSSLQWFQIKHGRPPTGRPDASTLTRLRDFSRRVPAPATRSVPVPGSTKQAPPAAVPPPVDDRRGPVIGGVAVTLLAAIVLLLAIARRRRRPRDGPVAGLPTVGPAPAPGPTRPPDPRTGPREPLRHGVDVVPGGHALSAVGYARGVERAELDRQSAAIRRTCSDRGWVLSRIVRDGGDGRQRPGRGHAFDQLAGGQATHLVVTRARDLGDTPAEVASRLRWCERHSIDVVALDVGLDTTTPEGRSVAQRLLSVADDGRTRRRAGRTPAIGYVCSTRDPVEFARHAGAIRRACTRRGWTLEELVRDEPAGVALERPGLAVALERLSGPGPSRLVVSRLAHLSSSAADRMALFDWFAEHDVQLVATDVGLDTKAPGQRRAARARLAAVAQDQASVRKNGRKRAHGKAEGKAAAAAAGPPSHGSGVSG